MEKYGKVTLINMPKKEDGKYKGYAFAVFDTKAEASKAISSINSSTAKLMGTKMVADWCLPKNIFLRSNLKLFYHTVTENIFQHELFFQTNLDQNEVEKEEENLEEKDEDMDVDDDEDDGSENEDDDENGEDDEGDKDGDNDDDEEDEDEDEDDEDEDDYSNEDDYEDEEKPKSKKKKFDKPEPVKKDPKLERKAKAGTQDVQEKRTVFVRNLSYDTTEEIVKEAFSKFGPIKYVKLVYDRELERPRGTGFIQFESQQSAIDACAESEILEVDFRRVLIDMALSRNQAKEASFFLIPYFISNLFKLFLE
jgi:nucleolar protein 4